MLPEFISKLLNCVAKDLGFVEYEIKLISDSNHSDELFVILTTVILVGIQTANGKTQTETLNLLCKSPPLSASRRESFKSGMVFAREIFVYSKLLPAFVRFQREKGLTDAECFLSFPKVYASLADEENDLYVLIMEDLRPRNYQMWPKDKTIALDHVQMFIIELAKFHAISFAMKDQRPDAFAEYKKLNDLFTELVTEGKLNTYMVKTIERAANVLKNPSHKKIMTEFKSSYLEMFIEYFTEEKIGKFGVVGHGDCWNNNFLYRYGDNGGHLESICILDWQLSRYSSPVLDLHYNIFSGTDKELRDEHYTDLMKLYHSTLSESIRKLGSDPEKLFSYADFQAELSKFGKYPLLTGPMVIQIRLAEASDMLDIDEYSEKLANGEVIDLIKEYNETTRMTYIKLINTTVQDLVEYGYV